MINRGLRNSMKSIAFMVVLAVFLSGCFTSSSRMDEPQNPIAYEKVVGRWENDLGEALVFRDDGSVLIVAQGFALGEGGEEIKEVNGEWTLCGHDYFAPRELGDGLTEIICDEGDNGLWIDVEPVDPYEFDPLIATEGYGDIELYRYHVDDAATSDSERYVKAE